MSLFNAYFDNLKDDTTFNRYAALSLINKYKGQDLSILPADFLYLSDYIVHLFTKGPSHTPYILLKITDAGQRGDIYLWLGNYYRTIGNNLEEMLNYYCMSAYKYKNTHAINQLVTYSKQHFHKANSCNKCFPPTINTASN